MRRRARGWCCWRSRAAATATCRSGSRWRGAARRKGSIWRTRPTWKGACRMRLTWPGLPDCIALLLPGALQSFETVFAHAMWLKTWFGPERAFIAVELLHHAHDALLVDVAQRVAHGTVLGPGGGRRRADACALAQAAARRAHRDPAQHAGGRVRPGACSPMPRRICARASGWRRCTRPSGWPPRAHRRAVCVLAGRAALRIPRGDRASRPHAHQLVARAGRGGCAQAFPSPRGRGPG